MTARYIAALSASAVVLAMQFLLFSAILDLTSSILLLAIGYLAGKFGK